ncbi:MAG: hypothetical protein IPQ12_11030, partial [Polaromonas sp.]|nr:hypothetical protein [Polaromonas sp.]
TALLINGDNTEVNGFWSDSHSDIGIGSSIQIIKNTVLRNLYTVLGDKKSRENTIFNISSTLGFDNLLIDGLNTIVSPDSISHAPIYFARYFNSNTKKGRNLKLQNITIRTDAPINSNGVIIKHIENLSISGVKYINSSGNPHYRLIQIENSKNIFIHDVQIDGVNQIGIFISNCLGAVTVSQVVNHFASTAAIYNDNCTDFLAIGCDQTKVTGQQTPTYQYAKLMVGNTSNRTVTGCTTGWTQYFDTTINKPIWWNGSGWSDSNGFNV